MANVNRKSVERQILDADLVTKMEKIHGEEGAEVARAFVNMDSFEQDLVVCIMSLVREFNLPSECLILLHGLFCVLLKADKDATTMLIKLILTGAINKHVKNDGDDEE